MYYCMVAYDRPYAIILLMYNFRERLFLEQRKPCICENGFVYFKPDFSAENELYRVDNEPINIMNNAENVPFLQNVAQQTLVDVGVEGMPTDGLSDSQIAELRTPRYVEVSEISDAANQQLKMAFETAKSQSQNDKL